ncbi:unnamed protein product [Prunus armeniaca]
MQQPVVDDQENPRKGGGFYGFRSHGRGEEGTDVWVRREAGEVRVMAEVKLERRCKWNKEGHMAKIWKRKEIGHIKTNNEEMEDEKSHQRRQRCLSWLE